MKRNLLLGAYLLAALVMAGACSSPAPAPATAQAPAPAAATSASVAAPTTVAAAPSAPQATAAGPVAVPAQGTPQPTRDVQANLPALKLNTLTSYQAQIEMRDEPVKSSTAVTATSPITATGPVTMEMRYQGQPTPQLYAWSMSGQQHVPGAPSQEEKMVMVGTELYSYLPDQNKWLQMPAGSPQSLPLKEDLVDPNRLAQTAPTGLFNKANIVNAHEMVDGVDTTHYRANETQMMQLLQGAGDQSRVAGSGSADFWVENNSGYLKKYVMVANLKDPQGQEYKQTITFTLTQENKPVAIATPAPSQIITMEQLQQSMTTPTAGGTPQAAPGATPQATP